MAHFSPTSNTSHKMNSPVLYVEHALIEEVSTTDGKTGSVLISFRVETSNNVLQNELLKLIVNPNTEIINEFAEPLNLCDLKKGMYLDASFSSAMTMSIPPQARAFQMIVRLRMPEVVVTTDRVVSVDVRNSFLLTGNPYEMIEQMRFVISQATIILNRNGERISLSHIKPGQLVRVEHASFQTLSIPPQTTAFRIQVLSA
ncbi:hypothetical protein [Candidatus Galacturonibacter soehngenii]|uniref:Uncharacterized protein n=1 Tax=Candidatus Galacturonatibacter soehngenii TaxID=2307010 RepID=A0A7V7QJ99_9FIRM|nr:hypothetical protein [Candidatus Galacturonibacter soehngenii]KAB1436024.1 hypothetical protein F7O84_16790 [Candidatus Galacturonibacter soehngenii]